MENFDYSLLLNRLDHYSGPVELHVTIQLENTSLAKSRFQSACKAKNGKSIWIELERGETVNQPMFGLRLHQSPANQARKIKEIVLALAKDFSIKRVKVEAGPGNKNIPQSSQIAEQEPADCYFEHHVGLKLKPDTDFLQLKADLERYHGYLSRNAFKTVPSSGEHIRFVTQRYPRIGQLQANARLEKLLNYAKREQLTVICTEREYNIFDTNLCLDQGWMK